MWAPPPNNRTLPPGSPAPPAPPACCAPACCDPLTLGPPLVKGQRNEKADRDDPDADLFEDARYESVAQITVKVVLILDAKKYKPGKDRVKVLKTASAFKVRCAPDPIPCLLPTPIQQLTAHLTDPLNRWSYSTTLTR